MQAGGVQGESSEQLGEVLQNVWLIPLVKVDDRPQARAMSRSSVIYMSAHHSVLASYACQIPLQA
jgi:hypothetical protein